MGAFVILHLLPYLGLKGYDILLTTGEETGNTSAKQWKTTKKYKWMFSFDRQGDDVVMYQYDTPENRTLLEQYDFEPARGSFSDIAALGDLGCSGFNFGCGMWNYHDKWGFCNLEQLEDQVTRFVKFFNEKSKTHIPFVKPKPTVYGTRSWDRSSSRFSEEDARHKFVSLHRYIYNRDAGGWIEPVKLITAKNQGQFLWDEGFVMCPLCKRRQDTIIDIRCCVYCNTPLNIREASEPPSSGAYMD